MRIRRNFYKASLSFFALVFAPSVLAQTSPATSTADYQLQKIPLSSSDLNKLGSGTGPTCDDLVTLYADVMSQQQNIFAKPPNGCDTAPFGIDYLIVNYVVWNANGVDKPSSVWYLLSPDSPRLSHPPTFAKTAEITTVTDSSKAGNRIFGSNRVGILIVHRKLSDAKLATAKIDYTLTVTHKQSVQAGDLSALIGLVGGGEVANDLVKPPATEPVLAVAVSIGAMPRLPADVALAGEAFLTPGADPDAKPDATFSQTYDDEGYSFWDISAAIPVTGIKDVQYTQDGSTVTAKTVTRANAYALAHFYPYKVDLKGDYPWQPSFVGGLALSGKPLDKPFVGLAIGTKKPFPFQVNVFAGAVFNKVFTSASATDATQLNSHRVTKLLYGIDIPIGKFVTAIKGK